MKYVARIYGGAVVLNSHLPSTVTGKPVPLDSRPAKLAVKEPKAGPEPVLAQISAPPPATGRSQLHRLVAPTKTRLSSAQTLPHDYLTFLVGAKHRFLGCFVYFLPVALRLRSRPSFSLDPLVHCTRTLLLISRNHLLLSPYLKCRIPTHV